MPFPSYMIPHFFSVLVSSKSFSFVIALGTNNLSFYIVCFLRIHWLVSFIPQRLVFDFCSSLFCWRWFLVQKSCDLVLSVLVRVGFFVSLVSFSSVMKAGFLPSLGLKEKTCVSLELCFC